MKKKYFFTFFVILILFLPKKIWGGEQFLKSSKFFPEKKVEFTIYNKKNFNIGLEKRIKQIRHEASLSETDRLMLTYPWLVTFETLRKNLKHKTSLDIRIEKIHGELTLLYPSCKFYFFDDSKFELNTDHLEVRLTITVPIRF